MKLYLASLILFLTFSVSAQEIPSKYLTVDTGIYAPVDLTSAKVVIAGNRDHPRIGEDFYIPVNNKMVEANLIAICGYKIHDKKIEVSDQVVHSEYVLERRDQFNRHIHTRYEGDLFKSSCPANTSMPEQIELNIVSKSQLIGCLDRFKNFVDTTKNIDQVYGTAQRIVRDRDIILKCDEQFRYLIQASGAVDALTQNGGQ